MRILILTAACALAFLGTWLSGYFMIPFLHKLKFGQPIKKIGPTWHEKKRGTPTMGGLMFIISFIPVLAAAMLVSGGAQDGFGAPGAESGMNYRLFAGVLMALMYAFCGFIDDYAKVKKQDNNGLSGWQKLVLQTLIAAAYLATLRLLGTANTLLWIPFAGYIELGFFYYPIMVVFIVGTVNAVNIHDGIDGLCSSVTLVASAVFAIIFVKYGMFGGALCAALTAGCCGGFLVHNHNPAKVIMGDLGSHFLGGLIVAMTFYLDRPVLLIPIGIVYYWEMFSVILQVISFKLTGKRIFKMSPIHHHYELSGWSEDKICCVFSAVGAVGGAAALALAFLG